MLECKCRPAHGRKEDAKGTRSTNLGTNNGKDDREASRARNSNEAGPSNGLEAEQTIDLCSNLLDFSAAAAAAPLWSSVSFSLLAVLRNQKTDKLAD